MPKTKVQVRRRLTALSCRVDGFGAPAGGETPRQFAHHAGTLGGAHGGPACNLVDGAAAPKAQPGTRIECADFDAGGLDHVGLGDDSAATIVTTGRNAIIAIVASGITSPHGTAG